jgi:hypothetical protein
MHLSISQPWRGYSEWKEDVGMLPILLAVIPMVKIYECHR